MSAFIRLLLTGALLVLVYGETGPWTVTVLGLLALGNELTAFAARAREVQP